MTVVHLGVYDVPYLDEPGGKTTGDVAEILEAKYDVVGAFLFHLNQEVANALADSALGAVEDELMGGPEATDERKYATGCSQTSAMFKRFLANDTMAKLGGYDGVPTKAALRGVNHRLKLKRGEPRPSFVDTGQYQASFVAWPGDAEPTGGPDPIGSAP